MSDTQGKWSASTITPGDSLSPGDKNGLFVIHAVLLNNGHVLWFSGHVELADYLAESWVWDPTKPVSAAFRVPFPPSTDIFCCHHVVLEDGRVLTAGGAAAHPNHSCGIKSICVYNTAKPGWEKIGDMKEARWYPTLVTLPDGRLVACSGHLERDPTPAPAVADGTPRRPAPGIAPTVELFKPPFKGPGYKTETLTSANKVLHIYPGLHLVKGGKIFYTGTTWRYEPMLLPPALAALSGPPGTPIGTFSLQVTGSTGTWTDEGVSPKVNLREEGTSILLPPAQDGKILLLGGCRAIGHAFMFTGLAAGSDPQSAEILNTQVSPPTWTPAGPSGKMKFPRINASAVLLPDATVFIVGGHSQHKWAPTTAPSLPRTATDVDLISPLLPWTNPHHPSHTTARFSGKSSFSNTPEIYDPVANTFTSMAPMNDPRTYHSACLLLPDGRVLCAGGVNPDTTPPELNMDGNDMPVNQKTMEFYEPTYLFKKPQPTITRVLSKDGTNIKYDGDFVIETPDADKIAKVVLMRPGAMTHHTDTEQRYVPLDFTKEKGKLKVKVLNDPTVAPPGFYMLWIVDNRKVPCKQAKFVRLTVKAIKPKVAKCDFPKGEVVTLVADARAARSDADAGGARFDDAFEIELVGFLPDELGIESATPTAEQLAAIAPTITFTREDGTVVPELSASPQRMILGDSTLPADKPQFVTIPYAVEFSGFPAFPPTDDPNAIKKQVIRLTATKGDFTGEDEITLFDDSFQRVIVKLRRTTGDQFVSTKEIELIDTCDSREETDTTVFVSAIRGGSLRAKLATMTDKVDVDV